jgi:hypothetical protein
MAYKFFYTCLLLLLSFFSWGQNTPSPLYLQKIAKADSFYARKEYARAAWAYSNAFQVNKWKGLVIDRYHSACAWARLGVLDSALNQLERIAYKGNYSDYVGLSEEPSFYALHNEPRWEKICAKVKENRQLKEAKLDRPLQHELGRMYDDYQNPRIKIAEIERLSGRSTREWQDANALMSKKDSINCLKLGKILDEKGWQSIEEVGIQGNMTLPLILQSAPLDMQKKYLTLLKNAVKEGKAAANDLAILEDKIALTETKKQIYGTQVQWNVKKSRYDLLPIKEEKEVDARRQALGLPPLSDYLKKWAVKN